MISDMVQSQFCGYILCLALGVVLGVAGSLVSVFARLLKKHIIALIMIEILYWLTFSVMVLAACYVCNSGELRFYIFFGIFSGFLFSYYTINWVIIKLHDHILCRKKKD